MSRARTFFRYFGVRPVLADLLAFAGMVIYASMLWKFAHIQVSVLDEGLYLYKGWLFTSERYTPFQAYGPWTNQMPLAFLIPGWVEQVFGPSLSTGRMMAIALGVLMLFGLWLTARRLGGPWIATTIVAAVVLNPAAARMYAIAASQGLVACILTWTMFFSLGVDRKNWQLFIGGLLAGAAVMVRINLLPLLPLLALYVLWEHWPITQGKATTQGRPFIPALWLFGGMLVTFGGIHLVYWPNILELWAKWLPFPFLKPWFPPKTIPTWNPDNPQGFRVASFFLAFRYHFAALAGALATWILWPKEWKNDSCYCEEPFNGDESIPSPNGRLIRALSGTRNDISKVAVFLSLLLLSFFFLHAWAALGNEYCVFCFPTYTSFYGGVGLLLVAVTLPNWNLNPSAWRKWLGGVSFLALLAGMAYSAEGTAESLLGGLFYKRLLAMPIPFLNGAQVWQVVSNKFRLEYEIIYDATHAWFPVVVAVAFGLAVLVAAKILAGRKNSAALGVGIVALTLIGSLFSPSPLLAGEYTSYDCQGDVLPGFEAAGAELAKAIPTGSSVYWAGYSPVTLLSLQGVTIYPSQLHQTYSFRISDDDDALLKYGWWNQHLAEKWLAEADFVLVEQRNLGHGGWLDEQLPNFERVLVTGPQSCRPDSAMLVFRKPSPRSPAPAWGSP